MSYDPQNDPDYNYNQAGDDEELGFDTHVPMMETDTHVSMLGEEASSTARATVARNGDGDNGPGRLCRVRPMSPSMAANYPDVATILITKFDGRQILMVRR